MAPQLIDTEDDPARERTAYTYRSDDGDVFKIIVAQSVTRGWAHVLWWEDSTWVEVWRYNLPAAYDHASDRAAEAAVNCNRIEARFRSNQRIGGRDGRPPRAPARPGNRRPRP